MVDRTLCEDLRWAFGVLLPKALPIEIRSRDGFLFFRAEAPRYVVTVNAPEALLGLAHPTPLGNLAIAYASGALEIEGDLLSLIRGMDLDFRWPARALLNPRALRLAARYARAALSSPDHAAAYRRGQGTEISFHYDLPVAFWRLLLGPELAYSCAWYDGPDSALDVAQRRKFEVIARKTRIAPGDRVLDVGCGWGGFSFHARAIGAEVTALTLSAVQADYVRGRAAGDGAEVRVVEADFFRFEPDASYDVIVAIGFLEHVGPDRRDEFFGRIRRSLKKGGRVLIQTTVDSRRKRRRGRLSEGFTNRFVFPGGYLATMSEIAADMEAAGFELTSVESLRENYVRTSRAWFDNLCAHEAEIAGIIGTERFRVFQLYLAGFCVQFESGGFQNYQFLAQVGTATRRGPRPGQGPTSMLGEST
jgi:cyclopropane-fatty-acyl-phospholipid synthase